MHQSDNEIVMPTLPFKMWGQVRFLKIFITAVSSVTWSFRIILISQKY